MDDIEETVPNNVIQFPRKSELLPSTVEEVGATLNEVHEMFLDQLSAEIASGVFDKVTIAGFDVSDEKYLKDTVLVVESIKALMMRICGKTYPLHQFTDSIQINDDDFLLDDEDLIDI